jgi:Ca-activated chloride channel family protein
MTFLSANWLWLLLLVVALLAAYIFVNLRRRQYTVRFTEVSLLASVAPKRPQWYRRHVPAALLLLSLAAMVVGLARPAHSVKVPTERATVMLAIDVSNSMAATDVAPSRLASAKSGAQAFIDRLPTKVHLGLVAFDGEATVLVSPTTDRAAVRTAVNNLQLGPATAIGEAVFACLDAIKQSSARLTDAKGAPPGRIVLLSDGETTRGRSNSEAAAAATAAKVPVSTIAYGTAGGTLTLQGQTIAVPVNEEALHELANATGGSYHRATSGDQLRSVYANLGSSIGYKTEQRGLDRWFTGLALALGLIAAAGSIWWGARLP